MPLYNPPAFIYTRYLSTPVTATGAPLVPMMSVDLPTAGDYVFQWVGCHLAPNNNSGLQLALGYTGLMGTAFLAFMRRQAGALQTYVTMALDTRIGSQGSNSSTTFLDQATANGGITALSSGRLSLLFCPGTGTATTVQCGALWVQRAGGS